MAEITRKSDDENILDRTGIYIAFLTSPSLKSIYPPKNYKAKVNNQHTNVGITKDSFRARKRDYLKSFDNEVEFIPVAIVYHELESVSVKIISKLYSKFSRVGNALKWFHTSDRRKVIEIILQTLAENNVEHKKIVDLY